MKITYSAQRLHISGFDVNFTYSAQRLHISGFYQQMLIKGVKVEQFVRFVNKYKLFVRFAIFV